MKKIRRGDEVIVLSGKDKGKKGKVLMRIDNQRLLVEGVNLSKKHIKPDPSKGIAGGFIEKALSIHQSNIAIFNRITGKSDRVRINLSLDEVSGRIIRTKTRLYKSNGQNLTEVS